MTSPKDERALARIKAAAARLRDLNEPEHAAAVDSTLTVEHLALLKRATWSDRADKDPNLPIGMTEVRRDLIRERVNAENETRKRTKTEELTLTSVIQDGFRRFLAGDFDPQPEGRPARGAGGGKRVTLNARPDGTLHADVAARCRDLRESGDRPGLHVSTVAAHALYERFRIGPYAPEDGAE